MFSLLCRTVVRKTARIVRGAFLGLGFACLVIADALAAAPQLKTQAPGYYRVMVGNFEITALSDGVFDVQTREILTHATVKSSELLANSFHGDAVPTSVNAFLVNTGEQLVLIDAGAAKLFGPTLGNLLVNLAASGYRPEQIDAILITHMHPDHIGGLVADGKNVFPNAVLFADQRDADYWLSAAELQKAPAASKGFFQAATMTVGAYAAAGRFRPVKSPALLFPGVRAIPAPGHTPGHIAFSIESQGQKLVVWGDLTEIASVQFAEPTVTMTFDADDLQSVRTREKVYADAVRDRYLVAGSHLPFPGLGHVRREGAAYAWVPIDYRSVP